MPKSYNKIFKIAAFFRRHRVGLFMYLVHLARINDDLDGVCPEAVWKDENATE